MAGETGDGDTMSNADRVRDFFRLQYAGDYAQGFARHAHADFRFVTGSDGDADLRAAIPWAGYVHEGQDGYRSLYEGLFGEYDVEAFEPRSFAEAVTDDGAKVYVEGRFRHKTTGRIAESDWCARFDMRDGRIAGGQFFENTYAVAMARRGAD